MVPFRNNGYLNPRETRFNTKLSSVRQIIERSFALLKGRWRRLKCVDNNEEKLITKIIMSAFVLHNFCLLHDDFDNGYFLDGGDDGNNGDDGNGGNNQHPPNRTAQQKRTNLMNLL